MQDRLELARRIAREAGELTIRCFYDRSLRVERKEDASPVTVADRGAEELLRSRIAEAFPDDAVLGEEFPDKSGVSGWRWLLDPIDGTKSFIHGVPLYSTLIGVEKDGESLIGVIAVPALDELLWAGKGTGAWHESPRFEEPRPARVSEEATLGGTLFLTSETLTFAKIGREDAYTELERRCRLTRTWGDAYGYFLVATGRAELMVDPLLSPWDAGPLLVVLEEAGGRFTDWKGNRTVHGGNGVGSNGLVHEAALEILNRFPTPY